MRLFFQHWFNRILLISINLRLASSIVSQPPCSLSSRNSVSFIDQGILYLLILIGVSIILSCIEAPEGFEPSSNGSKANLLPEQLFNAVTPWSLPYQDKYRKCLITFAYCFLIYKFNFLNIHFNKSTACSFYIVIICLCLCLINTVKKSKFSCLISK